MDIHIAITGDKELSLEKIFKLGQYLDAYEVEKDLEDTLVIDIKKISKDGNVQIYLTPQGMMTYDEICDHIKLLMDYAMTNSGLTSYKWDVKEIVYHTKRPGLPSYMTEDAPAESILRE